MEMGEKGAYATWMFVRDIFFNILLDSRLSVLNTGIKKLILLRSIFVYVSIIDFISVYSSKGSPMILGY